MAKTKKYLTIINYVDGSLETQFVEAGNKLHIDIIAQQILHAKGEYCANDQSPSPTIKQLSIIPIKGDIFEYKDLDTSFNEAKQKFIDLKNSNSTGGIK